MARNGKMSELQSLATVHAPIRCAAPRRRAARVATCDAPAFRARALATT